MELSKKHFQVSTTFFLAYLEAIILLSCFNLQGLNLLDLATASPEARGNATDLQALVQFKAKITGDQFKIMESWNSSIHFCQWPGVTCGRKHQRVTKLELQFLKISGSLSPYIGNLSFLRELRLVGTNFYNQIPQEIGRLRRLEVLDLTNNSISGKIPSNLSSCSKLTVVDMGGNQLTGEIPTWLGLFSNLRVLGFYRNSLRGSIPHSLGNLSSLEKLRLAYNALSGIIPEALGQLTKLSFLSIATNAISGVVPVTMFNLSNMRTFDISENKIQGSFGSVYKGILEESGATIAVKVLNLLNRRASRSFMAECEILKNIRHRNLVRVLTAISSVDYRGNDFKALVYEFMENGNLEDWLHPSSSLNELETMRNLNFFQRVDVAIDVAHALEYLHHRCEMSIVHCDLKPSNVLLDDEMVGHISDFGLAKILFVDSLNHHASQSSSLGLRGTIGYAPPEYGMGSELSTKGDVYSYGILLLEMFTGKRPTDERFKEGLSLHIFVKEALPDLMVEIIDPILLQEGVREGTVTDITRNANRMGNDGRLHCLNSIFKIGLTCSVESPVERMDMSDVVAKLCSIRDKLLRPTRLRHGIRTPYPAQSAGNNVFLS
ncbi:probable LRR receptor-like serine/threonine-protein kinase At3g47570 isoform X2 [Hibiscus syriacus]|uniref:probable LRR receptor-like serine/threonine-protein kinase At3g47570 isoform X2 n=1 Tax=Hibiscus syriacus TaxID=106335 RepID=UPI001920E857|nr:probable LRR receptor-like serine/threonine-protein kinase At3g47570 isoform X2 [Hibiscus syriacus]